MKKILFIASFLFVLTFLQAQTDNVGIGTNPDPLAKLDISATDAGLLIPRADTAAINVASVGMTIPNGLLTFQPSDNSFYYWNAGHWKPLEDQSLLTDKDQDTKITFFEGVQDNMSFSVDDTLQVRFVKSSMGNFTIELPNNDGNIGVGEFVLTNNSTGINNVALGKRAMGLSISPTENIAIGTDALYNSNGTDNISVGRNNNQINIDGNRNTAMGSAALLNNIEGSGNVAIGYGAGALELGSNKLYIESSLFSQDSSTSLIYGEFDNDFLRINGEVEMRDGWVDGDQDTKITLAEGAQDSINFTLDDSLQVSYLMSPSGSFRMELPNNQDNIAIGSNALRDNTTGAENLAHGVNALRENTTGSHNIAHGKNALRLNTEGNDNTAMGWHALYNNSTGDYNIAAGRSALVKNTEGSHNIAIGLNALRFNTIGDNNIAVGASSLSSNTEGNYNIANGEGVMFNNTTGSHNAASGHQALIMNTEGNNNIALGELALRNFDASNNIAIGKEALLGQQGLSTGQHNIAIGDSSLLQNTAGYSNIAIGDNALNDNTIGANNIAQGTEALYSNTIGLGNIATGYQALYSNTGNVVGAGSNNIATGHQSLFSNTLGRYNLAQGFQSLYSNTLGRDNIALGEQSLRYFDASYNIAIGSHALVGQSGLSTGDNNIAIGQEALSSAIGDKNIAIGYQAGYDETGSNKLYIENSSADSTGALIYGEFDNDILRVNGTLQVNDPAGNDGYSLPNTRGNAGDVLQTNADGTTEWTTSTSASTNLIIDADGDTKIQVEEGTDDDIIRFDINGQEQIKLVQSPGGSFRIEMPNNLDNIAIGHVALLNNTLGLGNIAHGRTALYSNTEGSDNIATGHQALYYNTIGGNNIATGYQALAFNTEGSNNIATGNQALHNNTTGGNNIATGINALKDNTTGDDNIAMGTAALLNNTTGIQNIANGWDALRDNIDGNNNVGLGKSSLRENESGNSNIALGIAAMLLHESGDDNVGIGRDALKNNITGTKNVAIGLSAGQNETGSNTLYIENSSANSDNALIYGEFDTNRLKLNGSTKIKGNGVDLNLFSVENLLSDPRFRIAKSGAITIDNEFNTLTGQSAAFTMFNGLGNIPIFEISERGKVGINDNYSVNTTLRVNLAYQDEFVFYCTNQPYGGLFYVEENGDAWLAGDLTENSDIRLKEDINPIQNPIQAIQKLSGNSYYWKDKKRDPSLKYGVIAQEVQKIFPTLVKENEDGFLAVNYSGLTPVLIEGFKAQQDIIDEQEKKIANQEVRIAKLEAAVNALLNKE